MVQLFQVLVLSVGDETMASEQQMQRSRVILEQVHEAGIGLVVDAQQSSGCIRVYLGLLDVIKAGARV